MSAIKSGKQSKITGPFIKVHDRVRLLLSLLKAMKGREIELPAQAINDLLSSILDKKETFLKSASDFGTPQYFYDAPNLLYRVSLFHDAFSKNLPNFQSFYAIKSNNFNGIIKDIVRCGMGLDCSSGRELSMALETDVKKILFSGPGKTDEELGLALNNRSRITILLDSFNELSRISGLLKGSEIHQDLVRIGIRIYTNKHDPWNKFGIFLDDLPMLMEKAIRIKGVSLCGIQFHSSWNLDSTRQVSIINQIGDFLSKKMPKHLLGNLHFLDIGGGFWPEQGEWLNPQNTFMGKLAHLINKDVSFEAKHFYSPSSPIEEFARNIAKAILSQLPPVNTLQIYAEPGRWISNSSMHILLRVIDQKRKDMIIADGGINLLGWERPMTEFIPIINLTHFSTKEMPVYIYGPLCTPDDIWGYSVFGSHMEIGDVLLVPNQGAYTYSLRQAFIKPISKIVKHNGSSLKEVEKEKTW